MLSVFGSINLDVSVRCAQLPAAGETVLGSAALLSPGGKGANQAHAAQRFGVPTRLFGAVGVDGFAMPALASLRDAGVGLGGVAELAHEATGLAMITVGEDGDNSIVVAPGANALARAAQVSDAVLRASRVLLLQLEVPAEESFALARRARAAGCRVVLNASPLAPSLEIDAASLDLVIVNMLELEQLCLQRGVSGSDAAQRALALASALQIDVLVTLGAAGSLLAQARGQALSAPALAVTPIDTTGAGDTYAGVFCAALADGIAAQRAMQLASVAAGLACLHPGAQLAQPDHAAIMQRMAEEGW